MLWVRVPPPELVTTEGKWAEAELRSGLSIAELEDWELHGAVWRPLEVSDERAIVELCSCSGEPMDVVVGEGRELIEFLRARR